jgi:ribosomal protein S18 acetylase RimI-like enzyme
MKSQRPLNNQDSIEIRSVKAEDLAAVAEIHLAAFPKSALTALGRSAVRRYYDWQLTGPHQVSALCATENEQLAGFCFGGVFQGAMLGFLRKNRTYLALRVATHPHLAFNPLFRDRLAMGLKILRRFSRRKRQAAAIEKPRPKAFGILSIGVSPAFQGRGIGRLLMDESEQYARLQGFPQMQLSVSPENQQAVRFYETLGWTRILQNDVWAGEMRKALITSDQTN